MKLHSLSVLFLLACLTAQADVVMVNGTVYDVGKGSHSKQGSIPDKSDDSYLCWAATCSNLFQHWQDRYLSSYKYGMTTLPPDGTQEGYSQPSGTRYLKIFDLFRENFKNDGGNMGNAVRWYFNGDDTNVTGLADGWSHAGYYAGYGIDSARYVCNPNRTGTGVNYIGSMSSFRSALNQAFYREGVGVFLTIVTSEGGYHAISCWGYETNSKDELVALYITDSDDVQFGARRVEVEMRGDGYIHFQATNPGGSYYANGGAEYIDEVWFLKPPASSPSMFTFNTDNIKLTSSLIAKGPIDTAVDATGQQVTSAKGITLEAGALLAAAGNRSTKITLGATTGSVEGDGLVARAGSMLNLRDGDVSISHFAGDGMVIEAESYVTGGNLSITDNAGAGVVINNTWSDHRVYLGITDNESVTISGNSQGGVQVHGAGKPYSSQYYPGTSEISHNKKVEISGNTAAKGGGVFAGDVFSIKNNEEVTFSGNTATEVGGAIASVREVFADQSSVPGNLVISGNTTLTFENNTATNMGGAAYANDTLKIDVNTNVTFSGNSAAKGGAVASDWYDNKYKGDFSISGNTSVSFEKNHATGGTGGALISSGSLTLANNDSLSFTGNTATQGGGAVSAWDRGTVTLSGNKDVTFSGNSTEANGGALHANATLTITGTTGTLDISGNKAVNGSAIYAATEKAGLFWCTSTVSIDNNATVNITGNVSSGADVIYNQGSKFSLSNNGDVTLSGNDAGSGSVFHNASEILFSGGSAFTDNNDHVMEIAHNKSVTFSGNKAQYDIYNEKSLYLCADSGQTITFEHGIKNSVGNETGYQAVGGTTHIGRDAADSGTDAGGTYVFTDGESTVAMQTTDTTVKAGGSMVLQEGTLAISNAEINGASFTLQNGKVILDSSVSVTGALVVDFGNYLEGNTLTMNSVVMDSVKSISLSLDLDGASPVSRFSMGDESTLTETTIVLSDYLILEGYPDLAGIDLSLTVSGVLPEGSALVIDTNGFDLAEEKVTVKDYTLDRDEDGKLYYSAKPASSDPNVPEPATATLSLLALAALAARRRRRK